MKKLFTILLFFVSLLIQAQTTYYVAPDGSSDNGGDETELYKNGASVNKKIC